MRNILPVVFLFLICHHLAAENVRISAEPLWLYPIKADLNIQPAAKTISNGYYIELIDHQVNLVSNTDYMHVIRHIVNETGVQNESEISVTFSPEFQQVVFHKILLIRNGTPFNQLNPSQIKVVQEETDAADFQYNGLKRTYVLLKDVQKGDRIDAAYSIVGFNPVFANKYHDKIYFSRSTAVCNYFETIITPAARKLLLRSYNHATLPEEKVQNGLLIYHWNNPVLKTYESLDSAPSWFDNDPYISVTEYANWQQVVSWGLETFKNYQYPLPGDLKMKISRWQLAAKGDKDIFAGMATRFVQDQVRYQGLEMGTYTHQPHTPSEVYEQRFGDCKDKALLLAAILREQGIGAYIALVNTTVKGKLIDAAPSTGEFDHAIVAIERSSGYIYIDPTDVGQRGELVNTYIPAYGYALVIRPGEEKLEPVEPGFLNATSILEKLDVSYNDSSNFHVSTTYAGGSADNIRSSFSGISDSELEDQYLQYYAKIYEGIRQAAPVETADDSMKNEITVKENYSIPALWHSNTDGRESFEVFAKALYEQLPNPASAGKNAPLALRFPASTSYIMEIQFPDPWNVSFQEFHIKNDSYKFDFVPVVNGDHISLRYYLQTFRDNISEQDLARYRTDYKKILESIDFTLYKRSGGNTDSSASGTTETNTNWLAVFFALLLAGGLALLLRHLDKRSTYITETAESWPLGGWLIVLGISLFVGGVYHIINFSNNNFFSRSVWLALNESGGVPLQLLLMTELAIYMCWLCGVVAMLYWYLSRRDIFPHMFLWYLGILAGGQLILTILYHVVPYPAAYGDLGTGMLQNLFRSIVYAAVWGSYIVRAERVRHTFTNRR